KLPLLQANGRARLLHHIEQPLHGGEWKGVHETPMGSPKTIDLDLAECEQRQIGRSAAAGICPAAMVDDGPQRCDEIGGQPLDVGAGHLLPAEDPVSPQLAVAYLCKHFQRMRSAPARGVPGPGSLRSKCEELGAARHLIE